MPPMRREEKQAICTLLVAAALALGASLAPGKVRGAERADERADPCRARTTGPLAGVPLEPYQRNLAQYRLVNDHGQYRRRGAPPCSVAGARIYTGSMLRAAAASYHALVASAARASDVSSDLLHAVITVESGYDPRARSPKGAQGLMQLMPATAKRYAVKDVWDPVDNLGGGARYLRDLLAMFDGNVTLALAAYNAGEEAVRKYANSIPPYAETREYVRRVLAHYHHRLGRLTER